MSADHHGQRVAHKAALIRNGLARLFVF